MQPNSSFSNSELGIDESLKINQKSLDYQEQSEIHLNSSSQALNPAISHSQTIQNDSNPSLIQNQEDIGDVYSKNDQISIDQHQKCQQSGQDHPIQKPQQKNEFSHSTDCTELKLPQKIHDYKILKFLGKGTFGKVLLAESKGVQYAIKTFDLETIQKQQQIQKQAKIMFSVEHPNVLDAKYFFPYNQQTSLAIVLQYCPDGDLGNFLGKLTPKRILEIELQINKGLRYLHNKNIIHRDLKLQNILMKNGKPKLADLGLAQVMKVDDQGSFLTRWFPGWLFGWAGTKSYMSPEVLKSGKYCKQSDIWSLGIVMLQLCTGKRVDKLTNKKDKDGKILKPAQIQGFPSQEILEKIKDPQMRAIVVGILKQQPSDRTSLEEIEQRIVNKKAQQYDKLQDDLIDKLPLKTGSELILLFQGNSKFPNIEQVSLDETTDEVLKSFAENGDKFPMLRQISISSDSITNYGIKDLTSIEGKFPKVEKLEIEGRQITDAGLKILAENGGNLPALGLISINSDQITEMGLNQLTKNGRKFPKVETIKIGGQKITDTGLKILVQNGKKFKNLLLIDVGKNQITDTAKKQLLNHRQKFDIVFQTSSEHPQEKDVMEQM